MDHNILIELFYGNISPIGKTFEKDSNYAAFLAIITENEKLLSAALKGGKEEHLFSQLMNAQLEILEFTERERFLEGFRIGAKIILDTFVLPGRSVLRDIT